MTDKRHGPQLNSPTVETIAGLSAGLLSTLIVHPLDILKTRLQITHGRPHPILGSSLRTLASIIRTEGPLSLYRGLTPNLVGNSSSWALYFLWYAQAQDLIRGYRYPVSENGKTHPLSTADYLLASAASGTLTALLTNPIWVVKTRMLSTPSTASNAYPSMLHGLRSIYRTEGLRGYFAGLTPALFGVSHGALYFGVYERLKAWQRGRGMKVKRVELTNMDTIFMSSVAKVVAGTVTYPHQVVRTRMQNYGAGSSTASSASISTITAKATAEPTSSKIQGKLRIGLMATVRNIWKEEGVMAFYKGLGPNLVRVVPSTCVTFLVYENVRAGLPAVWSNLDGEERDRDE